MPIKKSKIQPVPSHQDFPIVGIGASAGGLEAFQEFLKGIPDDSGMAYVLVQHLDPNHDSSLTEILTGYTEIPVMEIVDDIHLAPNIIYVMPENKILTSVDGVLKLHPRAKGAGNNSIDIFFKSLAEIHLNLAVGVVLSGKGADGSLGLKEVKDHGGFTFVQNPEEAASKDMPENAIDLGFADYILPASEIALKIMEIISDRDDTSIAILDKNDENVFNEIIQLLRQHSGVDFTYYKQTTIRRRIARRMGISKSLNLTDYLKLLRSDKTAPSILFNDLLIPVTEFFRDPKIFQIIKETVFPAIINRKAQEDFIRIWVAGCSTGEEAYTLAISLHEFLGENLQGTQIQIFASDISELAIAKARIGFYTKSQLMNVPEIILKKYFTKNNSGYQIKRHIRDVCVFAVHNFLKDPPFARMDLITCRNVLIYMDPFLQKKSLTTFHYALKEEGFLLLGKSETATPAEDLFLPFEKSAKIYTRKEVIGRLVHAAMGTKDKSFANKNKQISKTEIVTIDFKKSAENMLLSRYTPASVVVNEQMDIVHIHGNISQFLEFSAGKPTFNLLKIAREGLAFELRNAWQKAKESKESIVKEGVFFKINGEQLVVTIEIQPLKDTIEMYFLVLFYKTAFTKEDDTNNQIASSDIQKNKHLKRIQELERELEQTRNDVNAIAEEQDASNEELQSTNEELLSGSEELQSLNEELETSKEELQSSNEELIIINQELLEKQQQINTSRNYTEAIVATLREPIVVLDTKLRIKNINRAFSKKYNIEKQQAEGKLIYEIQNHLFDNAPMRAMLEKVLPQKTQLDDYQITVNLQPYGESIMLLNAKQVTNETSNEKLILLAIEDITERKIIEKRLQDLSDGFESKVKERTSDLVISNTELGVSVKELFEANQQLQQFAYVASHDLQEPLRKIMMFTSRILSQKDILPTETMDILEKISSSSSRMRTLIEDILAYSYLNNHEEMFMTTDLNVIIKAILTDFELLIEEENVQVKIGKLPTVKAIPLQMNQLFYNLMSNAIKFSKKEASPLIMIKSRKVSKKRQEQFPELDASVSYCEIIIKDNGIGLDTKYATRIFTIFQRLHNSGSEYKGTGIGLAISKKIIENHRGHIFVIAKAGAGAAFHVLLPI